MKKVRNLKINIGPFIMYLKKDKQFLLGIIIFSVIFFLGFVLSLFAPFDPRRWNSVPKDMPPSLKYPLGTSSVGQDLFWYLTLAYRNSIILGFTASAVGLLIGGFLGLIAGYKGGIIEKIILFFSDTLIVLPGFPLLILIGSLIKKQLSIPLLGLIIASITWGMPVRNVRSMVLRLRETEFTYTAKFSGMSTLRIITLEYIPHISAWVLASLIGRTFMAIGMEITLAIVGLSTLSEATLGTMIYWALKYSALPRGIWWWLLDPIIASILLFVSLYLISKGINEYLDPRHKLERIAMRGE